MQFQLDFSILKTTTENQLKSNIGKPLENGMVWSVLQGIKKIMRIQKKKWKKLDITYSCTY